jgi:hypothetical protein
MKKTIALLCFWLGLLPGCNADADVPTERALFAETPKIVISVKPEFKVTYNGQELKIGKIEHRRVY